MIYQNLSLKNIARIMNFYPPYLGAGVRVKLTDEERRIFRVTMPLNLFNKNYVGVHFGGSLYSMVDPFFMLILMNKLGRDYIVWDKKAEINFKRPGKGKVWASFEISEERVLEIKKEVNLKGKLEPIFEVDIKDEENRTVASVKKTLWVKKKIPSPKK